MIDLTEWNWNLPAPEQKRVRVLMVHGEDNYAESTAYLKHGYWTLDKGDVWGPVVAWAPLAPTREEREDGEGNGT